MFQPVNGGRVSGAIVDQVVRAIESEQLLVGDRLPSERALTERFGVGRGTVRDALRVLEAKGLVEVRPGAQGGAFVTEPQPSAIGENLARMLTMASVEPGEVLEVRQLFELVIVDLACERATDEDLQALANIVDRTERAVRAGEFHPRLSAEFHQRLADAAHNRALGLLFRSIHGAIVLTLLLARDVDPSHGERGVEEHRELVEAIRSGDRHRARDVMERHVRRTADRVRERET